MRLLSPGTQPFPVTMLPERVGHIDTVHIKEDTLERDLFLKWKTFPEIFIIFSFRKSGNGEKKKS